MNRLGRSYFAAALSAAMVVVAFSPPHVAAQTGTLGRRVLTFSQSGTAKIQFSVPSLLVGDPNQPPATFLLLEFAKDGAAPVADPGLGAGVSFVLTKDATAAPAFTIATLPSGNTTMFTDKTITMSRPDAAGTPGLFLLTINHAATTTASEAWTLDISSIPTGTPPMRGMASITGTSSVLTQLQPIGPCPTGGSSPPCPLCPFCPYFPWWELVVVEWPRKPLPPPPPCLSCPLPWNEPIGDDFKRTLVSFVPLNAEDQPIGPGYASDIRVNVRDGEALAGVMDGGNGEYYALIQHEKGETPSMSVTAAGYTSDEVRVAQKSQAGPYKTLTYLFALLFAITVVALIAQRRRGVQGV